MRTLRVAVLLSATLAGCAQFWRWDAPPQHSFPEMAPAPTPVDRPGMVMNEYRVARGDTLFAIAFKNNLDYRELARWNGISGNMIVPGQLLRLSAPMRTSPVAPKNSVVKSAVTPPATQKPEKPVPAPVVVTAPPTSAPAAVPLQSAGGYEWQWPTAGSILQAYAPAAGNKGIDFTGNLGQPVFAAAPGRVVYSGNALKGYGELIIIKHDDLHLSAYGYNRKRHVVEGDIVTTGQPIGELGLGPQNKPLLHFEIRERGKPVDPSTYLPPRPSSG